MTTGDGNNAGMAGCFLQLTYHFKAAYIWQVDIREHYIEGTDWVESNPCAAIRWP